MVMSHPRYRCATLRHQPCLLSSPSAYLPRDVMASAEELVARIASAKAASCGGAHEGLSDAYIIRIQQPSADLHLNAATEADQHELTLLPLHDAF